MHFFKIFGVPEPSSLGNSNIFCGGVWIFSGTALLLRITPFYGHKISQQIVSFKLSILINCLVQRLSKFLCCLHVSLQLLQLTGTQLLQSKKNPFPVLIVKIFVSQDSGEPAVNYSQFLLFD